MFEADEYQDDRFDGLEARNLERSGVAFYDCTFESCNTVVICCRHSS